MGRVPPPNRPEQNMFSKLRRASLILDELQRESLEELGLSFVEYSALRVIDREGPPYEMSPTRLATMLVRTTGGVTKLVDRLEARGLVQRRPDESDRRSVAVVLTGHGQALCRRASEAYRVAQTRVLSRVDRSQVPGMNERLDELLEAFEAALQDGPVRDLGAAAEPLPADTLP